jgi:mycothiol synthase
MAIDLAAVAKQVPNGLRVRLAEDADLERIVDFGNRYATASQWTSPASARYGENASREPLRLRVLVEDAAGDIVAVGTTSDGGLFRPPDGSWQLSLRVAPAWRRRGVGRAILGVLEAHARANGSSRTVTSTRPTDPDGARFAEAHGYRAFHERIDSYIDVPAFDASHFEDPDEAMRRIGIRLATFGALMTEHAADVEAFQRALFTSVWPMVRDVPSPMPLPETPPPFEQVRMFLMGPGIDPTTTVVALRGDQVVGLTFTAVKENGSAYTNLTGVARAERGKGIALAMKLRALRALKERGVKLFGTTNDEQNAAMRGINKKLGYVPDPPTVMYEKKLT